ncbi:DUF58 domain-containing protein [Filimonas lacunae]|nr:DUF58 domain-containing protein [Filimonas lacunae]BAV04616.1 hypothetical protein FLA_0608 [Filimonas lacunae]
MYVPVTWYFLLFVISSWLAFLWLLQQQHMPETSFSAIFSLLLLVAFASLTILVSFAFLTVLLSFIVFTLKKRRNKVECRIDTPAENVKHPARQLVHVYIAPVLKPILGFIKLRLIYDDNQYSNKFTLVPQKGQKNNIAVLEGVYEWPLPQIREYNVAKVMVYFEDFLQFFSFTFTLPCNSRFYIRPQVEKTAEIKAAPRKTEETNQRIEELKKVEGEHLHYKNFEAHDDVRRIVWKIYARNRELVVRTPEIQDPYASHLCLFASFHTGFDITNNEVIHFPFQDYFKTAVWNTYLQLVKQGFEVEYIADQQVVAPALTDVKQAVQYSITASHWQTDKDLHTYIKPKDAAVVVISSLNSYDEVARLVEQHGNDITFVFVQLSKSIRGAYASQWLQWLFVSQEANSYEVYKSRWRFSRLRSRILANEKKIKHLLAQYEKPVVR